MTPAPYPLATDSAYGFNTQGAAALHDAGIHCALRYHYNLTTAERELLHAHGIGVGFIAEYDTITFHPVLAGYHAGDAHGIDTVAKMAGFGFPGGCAGYATADTAIPPQRYPDTEPYVRAFSQRLRAAGYLVGLYGGQGLLDHLYSLGLIDLRWASAARSWDYGHSSGGLVLHQQLGTHYYGGTATDHNTVLGGCGHWPAGGEPYEGELGMDDVQVLSDKIDALGLGLLALAMRTRQPHTAYHIEGDDAISYLSERDGLPIRVHMQSPVVVDSLRALQYLAPNTVELTHADHQPLIDYAYSLPVAELG